MHPLLHYYCWKLGCIKNIDLSLCCYYSLQRSCEGYVFTRVCLSTGGSTWAGYPPRTRCTPRTRYTSPGTTPGPGPLGTRNTPPRTRYTPWDQIPPSPKRRLLLWTVRNLLECIPCIVDISSHRGTRKLMSVPILKYLYHWF